MIDATKTDLLRRAQQGDKTAIGEFYNRFRLSIYRYLYYRVGNEQVAEDLTSEVFLRMIRFISSFRPQGASFQAWLFQIARNIAIDHHRKMNNREHSTLDETIATGDDAGAVTERHLNSITLRQALAKLPDEQRDVIILRFVAGMPIAEVAQSLHKSEDSIKGLQRRGLIALRNMLDDWKVPYV